jgi:hypothetical protein
MARLYEEAGLGRLSLDVDTYEIVTDQPSRYLKRSVDLVNRYANEDAKDVHTDEDWPVTLSHLVVCLGLALLVITPFAAALTGLMGRFEPAWIIVLLLLVCVNAAWKLITKETLVDFLTSRVFGAPAQPMLYIERAWKRGQVRHRVNGRLVPYPHLSARE